MHLDAHISSLLFGQFVIFTYEFMHLHVLIRLFIQFLYTIRVKILGSTTCNHTFLSIMLIYLFAL